MAAPVCAEINATSSLHIQGVISGIPVIVPITDDLFVELAVGTDPKIPLWFFDEKARRRSAEIISEVANDDNLAITSFSYNFDREAVCSAPSWPANFCWPVPGGSQVAIFTQIVFSAARSERPMTSAYALEAAAAKANGGVFEGENGTFLSSHIGQEQWLFHCSKIAGGGGESLCSTWYYPHKNLSARFNVILPKESIELRTIHELAVAAEMMVEFFTSEGDFK